MKTVRTYVDRYIEIQAKLYDLDKCFDCLVNKNLDDTFGYEVLSNEYDKLSGELETMLNTEIDDCVPEGSIELEIEVFGAEPKPKPTKPQPKLPICYGKYEPFKSKRCKPCEYKESCKIRTECTSDDEDDSDAN